MSSIDDLCGLYVNAAEQFVRFAKSEKSVLELPPICRFVMIAPEIVVEQIVVNPDNSRYSYFGNGFSL